MNVLKRRFLWKTASFALHTLPPSILFGWELDLYSDLARGCPS